MAKGFKSKVIDIAMKDGSKVPKNVRTWGRIAAHKLIGHDGQPNTRLTAVTDVMSGMAVFYFRSADKAGGFASWLNDYLGPERDITSLAEDEMEKVRAVIAETWNHEGERNAV